MARVLQERKKALSLGSNAAKKDPTMQDQGNNVLTPNTNNFADTIKNYMAKTQNGGGTTNSGWGSNWGRDDKDDGHINVNPGSNQNAYNNAINSLIDQAVNRQPFEYDPATDAAYQAYARQYTRLGNQAAQDTLADVAAQTGGLASSYATTAASQARANYNQALTDKIPELMELAYNKYRNQYQDTMTNLDFLTGRSDSLYSRYADQRDYELALKQYQEQLAQSQNAEKYSQMLSMWETLGYANSAIAAFFGVPVGTKTDDAAYRAAQLALQSRP